MTITMQTTKVVYLPDGTQTQFSVPFPIIDEGDVVCLQVDGLTETLLTAFTVSEGNVTFSTPPAAGKSLVVRRRTARVQESDYPVAGRFPADVVERDFDRLTAMVQELDEQLDRAVLAPSDGSVDPGDLFGELAATVGKAQEYANAAGASANMADDKATDAENSAQAAASSAATAAQTVAIAAAEAVNAATAQSNAAEISAAAAAQSAEQAAAAIPDNLVQRVTDTEAKNMEQDARLAAVEGTTTQQSADIATNATAISAHTTALAGKANADLSNVTVNAIGIFFHARDVKPVGTDGGTSASAAWQTRDLNTVVVPQAWASLSANRVTLNAGKYYIRAATPAMAPFTARAAIYDVTHGGYLLFGPTIYGNTYDGTYPEPVEGVVTFSEQTTIELRQFTGQSVGGYGLGRAGTSGLQEIYSEFRAWPIQQ